MGYFDPKSDKTIFLGYSDTSKGYRVYNLKSQTVELSMHIIFVEFDKLTTQRKDVSDQNSSNPQDARSWKMI